MVRVSRDVAEGSARVKPGVVLPFPAPTKAGGNAGTRERAELPRSPDCGERPTVPHSSLREWLRAALVVSVAVHVILYAAFNLRFEDDLERAKGAAAAAASDGTITIPIEVVVEAVLPSAPAPTDAGAAEAEQPVPAPTEEAERRLEEPDLSKIASMMPPPPQPAPVVIPEPKLEMPQPPEPAPVVLPSAKEAARLALPEEAIAVPMPVERADAPKAPVERKEERARPPAPKQAIRPPEPQKSAPSRAASPSRVASANSQGSSGASGSADAGGRAAVSSYQAQVLAHLSRHRVYPPEARSQGITGVVRVVFSLGRDGHVLSASLAGGSGRPVLDQAALAMVRNAAPFPPFPSAIAESRLAFGAPIRFDLR